MTKNIIVTCVVSCDLFNEFVSFKAEITPAISATELFRIKAKQISKSNRRF
ncbi:MAG: hypothetical protein M3R50_07745 [Bacteroidota bacterium]|nr:hypothetical protein [Bacteroidota bacterium]